MLDRAEIPVDIAQLAHFLIGKMLVRVLAEGAAGGLTLNEVKTSVKDSRAERFDFLGYSFGAHCYQRKGDRYLGASTSEKSVKRMKTKINDVLVPGNTQSRPDVCNQLNSLLRGWSTYFSHGTRRLDL
jgi:RNA-directed DNA polymerase